MGVSISKLIPRREIELSDLAGKRIAIDALNMIFQFVAIIRNRFTGQPLRDRSGRVTSHLSGLLYRTLSYLESGIEPVYVFDGPHPGFKARVVAQRRQLREAAKLKWEEAVKAGEPAMRFAQASGGVNRAILQSGIELLELMGVPSVQAPSEGEAPAPGCAVSDWCMPPPLRISTACYSARPGLCETCQSRARGNFRAERNTSPSGQNSSS